MLSLSKEITISKRTVEGRVLIYEELPDDEEIEEEDSEVETIVVPPGRVWGQVALCRCNILRFWNCEVDKEAFVVSLPFSSELSSLCHILIDLDLAEELEPGDGSETEFEVEVEGIAVEEIVNEYGTWVVYSN